MGSHAENGNCALFEHAATISSNIEIVEYSEFILKFQFEEIVIRPIDIKIIISPIRLLSNVIVPEEEDEKF